MILGNHCTRNCRFCAVNKGVPEPPDKKEPQKAADAVKALGLRHTVITSVTRDDLPDGGSGHFADTIRVIKHQTPETKVEVLIPDFQGSAEDLKTVVTAAPPCAQSQPGDGSQALPAGSTPGELPSIPEAHSKGRWNESRAGGKIGSHAGAGGDP